MHVPPYHKKRSFQVFLLGMFVVSIIAYIILAFMYGKMYENILTYNMKLQSTVEELERRNEALLADKQSLEKRNLTVQSVEINFSNTEDLRMDRLILPQLEDLI